MSSTPIDPAGARTVVPASPDARWADVGPLALHALELSLDSAPLETLEATALATRGPWLKHRFAEVTGTQEAALLATCHRVELLLVTSSSAAATRWLEGLPGDRRSWVTWEGREAVARVFRVASGLESLAAGEAEVRQQVRAARETVQSRQPRPILKELFFAAAEAADAAFPSGGAAPSVASVASGRLKELLDVASPRVLVVGTGTVGRQLTAALTPWAEVTMAYHRAPPEEGFLRALGARAVPFERLPEELRRSDAVVTAAKFGGRGLRARDLPTDRPLVLVDLGVPRNIEPAARELANVRLVDLEELHRGARACDVSGSAVRAVEGLAADCSDRIERLLLEPWVSALRRAAEEVRRSELALARRYLGTLDPQQDVALDLLTRRLVDRLLHAPTERMRQLPSGPDGERIRRLALELLSPSTHDP